MFIRALSILAMVAAVVAAAYEVANFYSQPKQSQNSRTIAQGEDGATNKRGLPAQRKADDASQDDARSVTPSPSLIIGPGTRIEQSSSGANSPNVISGGSVNIQSK